MHYLQLVGCQSIFLDTMGRDGAVNGQTAQPAVSSQHALEPDVRRQPNQENARANDGLSYDKDAFLVRFEDGDAKDPMNFSSGRKALLTLEMGLLALTGTVGSSIITPAESALSAYLDISMEATVLTLSLFVLGTLNTCRINTLLSGFSRVAFFLSSCFPSRLFKFEC